MPATDHPSKPLSYADLTEQRIKLREALSGLLILVDNGSFQTPIKKRIVNLAVKTLEETR